ncbi:hypothetical protein TNCV_4194601 [Trichonephila clavipes]|nr:hypothetical protein TNCV_4194601 [Trichonephila clavipes]
MDHVIFSHGQVTGTTPERAPPTTSPHQREDLRDYGHELVAGVSRARALLPLKTRRVDEAIPPADVVVRKEGFQLRCPPRHSTKAQNYKVCDQ